MHYTIYRITNIIDGKFYIGKHQTEDLNDEYFGSGKLIKRAIRKYGIENFKKEILFIFETEQEMNDKEKELVVIGESSYNLCEGGHGGFSYINKSGKKPWAHRFTPEETQRGISRSKVAMTGKTLSEDHKEKVRLGMIGNRNTKGHTLSEEHKRRISASLVGNKNKLGKKMS
jgi:hypothetical protein